MKNEYGKLKESKGRYTLHFERFFPFNREKVFTILTDPQAFSQWYPFATGEMDLKIGGKISFDDGEGSTYQAIITKLKQPETFEFKEIDDILHISLTEEPEGCRMVFCHTFDDKEMAMSTAAGWHRCLDVLSQIIHGQPVEWKDNSDELRDIYQKAFYSK